MARYTGPRCRLCRREGIKLFLKGERCYTEKCAMERRDYPPGVHFETRTKPLGYGLRLREKQKLRRIYGISERQFRRFFSMAKRRKGITGTNLLILLERRLDNVVYRLGFATSRSEARQLVSHRHILVNGRTVNLPSFLLKMGDTVEVKEKDMPSVKSALESVVKRGIPSWLELDEAEMKGRVRLLPSREDIHLPIDEHLVVEFYSR